MSRVAEHQAAGKLVPSGSRIAECRATGSSFGLLRDRSAQRPPTRALLSLLGSGTERWTGRESGMRCVLCHGTSLGGPLSWWGCCSGASNQHKRYMTRVDNKKIPSHKLSENIWDFDKLCSGGPSCRQRPWMCRTSISRSKNVDEPIYIYQRVRRTGAIVAYLCKKQEGYIYIYKLKTNKMFSM